MAEPLQLGGKSPSEIYTDITKAGISQADASLIVSGWIYQNFGKVKHVFNYVPAFAATNANDASHFAQSFHHTPWVDGESVVQAEQTVGEDGFNLRLTHIESDLASLGTEVARAFTVLADLRKTLSVALEEIRTEINRINSDVFDCCT